MSIEKTDEAEVSAQVTASSRESEASERKAYGVLPESPDREYWVTAYSGSQAERLYKIDSERDSIFPLGLVVGGSSDSFRTYVGHGLNASLHHAPDTPDISEPEIDEALARIEAERAAMERDQQEINALKNETRALLSELLTS